MGPASRAFYAAAALLLVLGVACADSKRTATGETDSFTKRLDVAGLISGILGIQKNGLLIYEQAFGKAVYVSGLIPGVCNF